MRDGSLQLRRSLTFRKTLSINWKPYDFEKRKPTLPWFVNESQSEELTILLGKVDRDSLKVQIETSLDDTTVEEIVEELPETQPRYIVLSYAHTHADGRVSYPLIFIYWIPTSKSIIASFV